MQRLGQLVIGLVVAGIVFWIGWTSPSLNQCLQEAYYNNPQQPLQEYVTKLYGSLVGYRLCVGDFVHANGDGIIAIFTVILGIATWRLWLATRDLVSEARIAGEGQLSASSVIAAAAEKSADAAIESNKINLDNFIAMRRAWLSIDDVKLVHPTKFLENRIVFSIEVTIKSFGETPATSIWIEFESYFQKDNGEIFMDAMNRFTTTLRSRPVELGETLFPNDSAVQRQRWAVGLEQIKDSIRTDPSGEKKVDFTIFIGVGYRITGDSEPHITCFAHGLLNVPIGTAVSTDEHMPLPRAPFLAGVVD